MVPSPRASLSLTSPRDPDGLAPSGFEMHSGEEPAGILPPENSPSAANEQDVQPPTPSSDNFQPTDNVLALLVGEPPPPPPTPPPRKRRSSSGRTSSGRRKKLGEVRSPDQQISFLGRSPNSDGVVKTFEHGSLDSPSEEENRNIAERLEAARDAIHKSNLEERLNLARDGAHEHEIMDPPTVEHRIPPTLSLPTPTEQTGEQGGARTTSWPEVCLQTVNDDTITLSSYHSPASNCTEQHANHLHAAPSLKDDVDTKAESTDIGSPPSASKSVSSKTTPPRKKFRPKTPERLRRAHRALTPDKKRLSQTDGASGMTKPASPVSTSTKSTHVSGSGKKLRAKTPERRFRQTKTPEGKQPKTPNEKHPKNLQKKGSKTAVKTGPKGSEMQSEKTHVREALKKNVAQSNIYLQQRHVENEVVASDKQPHKLSFLRGIFRNKKKKRVVEPDTRTVSSEALLTTKSGSMKSDSIDNIAQNKPVVNGNSTNENKNGATRNFETSSGSSEDGHVLLGHDEVSTLTNPTYDMRRQDPTENEEASSDPVGHYFNKKSDSPMEVREPPDSSRLAALDPKTDSYFDKAVDTSEFSTGFFADKSTLQVEIGGSPFDPFDGAPNVQGAGAAISNVRDPTPRGNDVELFIVSQNRDPSPSIRNPSPAFQDPSPRGCPPPRGPNSCQEEPFGASPLQKLQRGHHTRDNLFCVANPPLPGQPLAHPMGHSSPGKMLGNPCIGDAGGTVEPKHWCEKTVDASHGGTKAEDTVKLPLSPKLPPTPSQRMRALRLRHLSMSPKSRELSRGVTTPPNDGQVLEKSSVSSPDRRLIEKEITSSAILSTPGKLSSEALSMRMTRRKTASPRFKNEAETPVHGNKQVDVASNEPIDSDLVLQTSSSKISSLDADLSVTSEVETLDSASSSYSKHRKQHLTMSSAARINARAVAYLHTLNGDPSPRRAWRKPEVSDEESSPRRGVRDPLDSFFSSIGESSAQSNHISNSEMETTRMFSVYSSRLKGRKPTKKELSPTIRTPQSASMMDRRMRDKPSQHVPTQSEKTADLNSFNRPATAFAFGVDSLRKKRQNDIERGVSKRVIPKAVSITPKVRSYFDSERVREPRDPIQRAGRRLLAKAAIPVQAQIRRFLAQREAVGRMWATIEIQSYVRRWRAEATILAYRECATKIQKVFRRFRVVVALQKRQTAVVEIQRIVRGFIASIQTFDTVYCIILVQAKFRGNLARKRVGIMKDEAATSIETWWRARSVRARYQFFIVDLIIVQSACRRWRARQEYRSLIFAKQIQAATKMQAAWRCFQGYTDYIFAVVDILRVQRTARKWLAKRKLDCLRRELYAIKIQSVFRKYRCQVLLLRQLVKIIIVQSVARRCIAKRHRKQVVDSATKIQKAWRGFWNFSHYVISLYRVSRLQALARGMLVRRSQNLQLGCSIMIQSAARRFLAKKEVENVKISRVLVTAAAKAMRDKLASSRIQFWWRVVLECRNEKHAALVIERFFLRVKHEVQKEINRSTQKHNSKRKSSRRKVKEDDEKWLERVWLNTVDEISVEAFAQSPSESIESSRLHGSSKHDRKALSHQASSPTLDHIMRHELASKKSPDVLNLTYSVDGTDLSPTSPSLPISPRRTTTMTVEELQDDLSLEEAFLDAAVEQGKKRRNTAEKYMKKFGLRAYEKTSFSPAHHFFADDLESTCSSSIQGVRYSESKSPVNSPLHQKQKVPQSTKSSSSHHARQLLHKMGHHMNKKPPKSPRKGESPRHGNILVMEYPEYSSTRRTHKTEKRDEEEYVGEEFGLI